MLPVIQELARIPLPYRSLIGTSGSDLVRWVVFSEPGFSADSHMTIRPFHRTWPSSSGDVSKMNREIALRLIDA